MPKSQAMFGSWRQGGFHSAVTLLRGQALPSLATAATACFALVANVLVLLLAHGLHDTPITSAAFLSTATTMPLSQSRAGQQMPCSSKVCRNLFGPVDHNQLQNDFQNLLRQQLEEAQDRWNFNFETDTPLEGRFEWERVFVDQQLLSLSKANSSESRSCSLAHKVPSKDHLGQASSEMPQQDSEACTASSPQRLKRRQTTVKDFYNSKRRIVPDKPKL
nr:PREDICTED: cyclin-dependent kinase inhibitor 1 [Apteryx mantelli mantelli]